MNKKQIGIIGATGYTGEELLRILAWHPNADVSFVTSESEAGKNVTDIFPSLPYYKNMKFQSVNDSANEKVNLVFLCLPAGESVKWAQVFSKSCKVVDLGADFRFDDPQEYKKWYAMDHVDPELLQNAAYGLPEWNREKIKKADIIGNPGCYPTSVLLATIPLAKAGLLTKDPVIVDAKSGVSGAGKSPTKMTHYVEANENLTPYKFGRVHRHVGEMEDQLFKFGNEKLNVIFTPHLTPISRGLFSTIYVKTKTSQSTQQVLDILTKAYQNEPFVQVLENQPPSAKMPANKNFCFISAAAVPDTNTVILFSAIDNIGKGASWQAVQNMNIMLGFEETAGIA